MADSKLDSLYNDAPFLIKHTPVPTGSANTSCTTIGDSMDNIHYEAHIDSNNEGHDVIINENPIFGINFKSQIDYKDVYTPNSINSYTTEYENNNIADYQINPPVNFYSNGLAEYGSANLGEVANEVEGENKLIYGPNNEIQHELGGEYNIHESSYIKNENEYPAADMKYNYEGYNAGFNGYSSTNYYSNPQNIKYQLYNLSQYNNTEIPMEKAGNEKQYNLVNNAYNPGLQLSQANINQSQAVGGYGNFDENAYDYPNVAGGNSISGVKYQRTDNRWIARWTTAEGKRACKSFSVNIYGFNQAKMLAIQARQKGVALSGRSFCNRERQHAMKSGVGIIGIRFDKTQARWVSSYYEGGKRKFRYFTVKDYGYEQAKRNAIIWKSCNDERLVKRVKEGYGFNYGVHDKFNPSMAYAPNYVNEEGYALEESRNGEPFLGNGYVDAYSTDYQSTNGYSKTSGQSNQENFDPNNGFVSANSATKYEDEYDPKHSIEYHASYNYPSMASYEVGQAAQYDEMPDVEIGGAQEGKGIWNDELLGLFKRDNVEYGASKAEADDMTTTTIGSDNHDLKSTDSIEYEEELDLTDENYEVRGDFDLGDAGPDSNVVYDRKRRVWIRRCLDPSGGTYFKFFPVSRHGPKVAKQLALSAD